MIFSRCFALELLLKRTYGDPRAPFLKILLRTYGGPDGHLNRETCMVALLPPPADDLAPPSPPGRDTETRAVPLLSGIPWGPFLDNTTEGRIIEARVSHGKSS